MCVLDTHSLDLRHLKPNQWTCVFLWNSYGNMPVNPDVPDEMLIPKSSRTLCCFCKFTANSMAKFTANAMSTTKLTLEAVGSGAADAGGDGDGVCFAFGFKMCMLAPLLEGGLSVFSSSRPWPITACILCIQKFIV